MEPGGVEAGGVQLAEHIVKVRLLLAVLWLSRCGPTGEAAG